MPERDRQIERSRLLRQLGRRQIDHDPILRPLKPGIHQRPLDPMRAFLDRRLGQPDQHGFRQRPGETSTSTSTGSASIPSSEKVRSWASIGRGQGLGSRASKNGTGMKDMPIFRCVRAACKGAFFAIPEANS